MPEISCFFGIVVTMYCADHALPHVHAECAGPRISVAIEDVRILSWTFLAALLFYFSSGWSSAERNCWPIGSWDRCGSR